MKQENLKVGELYTIDRDCPEGKTMIFLYTSGTGVQALNAAPHGPDWRYIGKYILKDSPLDQFQNRANSSVFALLSPIHFGAVKLVNPGPSEEEIKSLTSSRDKWEKIAVDLSSILHQAKATCAYCKVFGCERCPLIHVCGINASGRTTYKSLIKELESAIERSNTVLNTIRDDIRSRESK
jgi:hypothetical protein